MPEHNDLETSTTLLRLLRQEPTNQSAWNDFVERYGRLIYGWCRHWGLHEVDAEDVTQNVLLELAKQMRGFVYDPSGSFRAWLRTIAYRSWCRFVQVRRRSGSNGSLSDFEAVCTPEAGADFLSRLEAEGQRELLERAMQVVRQRVQAHTWEAFHLMAVEQCSGAEVAERLRMNVGTVFVARSKVQKMLREEIERLNEGATF